MTSLSFPAPAPQRLSAFRPPAGSSCKACRHRKVKCNRAERLDQANETDFASWDVECDECAAYSIGCHPDVMGPRHGASSTKLVENRRLGKSIKAILAYPPVGPEVNAAAATVSFASPPASIRRVKATGPPPAQDGSSKKDTMLGVRGLTCTLLEASVNAYFCYRASWDPLPFGSPYLTASQVIQAAKSISDTSNKSRKHKHAHGVRSVGELSEALLLAIVSVGAGLLRQQDTNNKFLLQDALYSRFKARYLSGALPQFDAQFAFAFDIMLGVQASFSVHPRFYASSHALGGSVLESLARTPDVVSQYKVEWHNSGSQR